VNDENPTTPNPNAKNITPLITPIAPSLSKFKKKIRIYV